MGRRTGIACFLTPEAATAASESCLAFARCDEGGAERSARHPGHTCASALGAEVPRAATSHGLAGDCTVGAPPRSRWSVAPRAQLAAHSPGTSPCAAHGGRTGLAGARRHMQGVRALRLPRYGTLPDRPRQGEVPIPEQSPWRRPSATCSAWSGNRRA